MISGSEWLVIGLVLVLWIGGFVAVAGLVIWLVRYLRRRPQAGQTASTPDASTQPTQPTAERE